MSDPKSVTAVESSTATVTASAPAVTGTLAILPKFDSTPKRGTPSRRKHTFPKVLYAYAVEHGGRVDLTPAVKADLVKRGLPESRLHPSIYDLRKYFGVAIASERTGRVVSALTFRL